MRILFSVTIVLFMGSCFGITNKPPELPSFKLLLQDSVTIFDTKQIPEGNPIVLVYFSPDCEHCQKETELLLHNMDSLKNVRFYFVTIDSLEKMRIFIDYYHLSRYPNILVGQDYNFYVIGHFKGVVPPYLIMIDRNKRQRGIISGELPISRFLPLIKEL